MSLLDFDTGDEFLVILLNDGICRTLIGRLLKRLPSLLVFLLAEIGNGNVVVSGGVNRFNRRHELEKTATS